MEYKAICIEDGNNLKLIIITKVYQLKMWRMFELEGQGSLLGDLAMQKKLKHFGNLRVARDLAFDVCIV